MRLYFALRAYGAGPGEIGSEATPAEFLQALWQVMAEVKRVLKPTGSAFINLGDKYANPPPTGNTGIVKGVDNRHAYSRSGSLGHGVQQKSLLGLPWAFALGCTGMLAALGGPDPGLNLILRAPIVLHKQNCLSGGARVYARMSSGDRPMMVRDLCRHYQPENVQLWNGHQWTQVLGWSRTPDDDGALELEFRSGERIGCTTDHRWPTTTGLKRAADLRVGDVVLQSALPEPDRPHYPAGLDADDIGWLVGLFIAEGSHSGKTIQIAGHRRETVRHERLARIADAYDGTCAIYQTSENGVTCNLTGPVLLGIISQYVSLGTAKTKRLRKAAWQRSNQFLAAVVEGYLDGDGSYVAKGGWWQLGFTSNDEWAADLRTLAARFGAVLRLRRRTTSFDGRQFPGWGGTWRWQRSVHHNAKQDTQIVAIRFSRARDFYDIGVADDPHLFALASGVLTHNSLPESVRDRVRTSDQELLFHLVKQPRYYAALDELREPHLPQSIARTRRNRLAIDRSQDGIGSPNTLNPQQACDPLGKLPGSVWPMTSEPLRLPDWLGVQHYAAFPSELPRRCILGWSPPGICVACGEGRWPVVEQKRPVVREPVGRATAVEGRHKTPNMGGHGGNVEATILGYACSCTPSTLHPGTGESSGPDGRYAAALEDGQYPNTMMGLGHPGLAARPKVGPWREYHLTGWQPPPTRPAVVLDCFGGVGTSAMVAKALGRIGLSFDLSMPYSRAAKWRVTSDHAAKAISRTNRERQGVLGL